MHRRIAWIAVVFFFLLGGPLAHAEGSVSGHITAPAGTSFADIKVVLNPDTARSGRLTVRPNKKGDFFFGIVQQGTWTLTVEAKDLVPVSIKVVVLDTDTRKERLNYQGPPSEKSQVFEVGASLKVTYDVTLGPPSAKAAPAPGAPSPTDAIASLLQSGDFQGALAKTDAALATRPDDPLLHYYRGFSQFKLKNYDEAMAEMKKTLELNPAQMGAHWVMGATLASQGKKAEAVAEFEKEVTNPQVDPATKLNSYVNIGILQRELGNRDASIAAFEKVIELDSKQPEAYSYLSELYLAAGKPDKAQEIQARGKALGLEDPKAIFNVGATYWNSKEFAKAEEQFRRAVELDPKFALAWKSLGYALVNLGKTDEAATAFNKYLELSPDAEDAKRVKELAQELSKK